MDLNLLKLKIPIQNFFDTKFSIHENYANNQSILRTPNCVSFNRSFINKN